MTVLVSQNACCHFTAVCFINQAVINCSRAAYNLKQTSNANLSRNVQIVWRPTMHAMSP